VWPVDYQVVTLVTLDGLCGGVKVRHIGRKISAASLQQSNRDGDQGEVKLRSIATDDHQATRSIYIPLCHCTHLSNGVCGRLNGLVRLWITHRVRLNRVSVRAAHSLLFCWCRQSCVILKRSGCDGQVSVRGTAHFLLLSSLGSLISWPTHFIFRGIP
jgi:hypothetical protein